MALINPLSILKKAQKEGYAVPAFNVHNMETIQAVVETAYQEKSPVIIQTTPGTLKHAGIEFIAAMVKAASKMYDIPMALHVDHCESFETIVRCIQNGYTSVMIDGSKLPYKDNVSITKKVMEIAHMAGVPVEAELGKIGGTEDDMTVDSRDACFTVPSEAVQFIEETGIDSLAVAIGTAHGVYKHEPKLDLERLMKIREIVEIPLVLHGASGVPDNSVISAISKGICKVNIATELKIPMANSIKDVFSQNPEENDPRNYMGKAKIAVSKVVRDKIRLCGSNGKA